MVYTPRNLTPGILVAVGEGSEDSEGYLRAVVQYVPPSETKVAKCSSSLRTIMLLDVEERGDPISRELMLTVEYPRVDRPSRQMGSWRPHSVFFIVLICTVCAFMVFVSFSCDAILTQYPFFTGSGCRTLTFSHESDLLVEHDLDDPLRSSLRKSDENQTLLTKNVPGADLRSYSAFDKFIISPEGCSISAPPFLLLVVFTRFDAFHRRSVIRETYGNVARHRKNITDLCGSRKGKLKVNGPRGVRLFFIVGKTDEPKLQEQLAVEAKVFGDIIQSDAFVDTYGEATRKGISLIHWSLLHCPNATFIAKADDDCWINLPSLVATLRDHLDDKPSILGHFWPNGAAVIRDPRNKWSVPLSDYPSKRYPPYLSGILYIFHRETLAPIAQAVTQLQYLWHDDVFLTGVAAAKAGISHTGLAGYDVGSGGWRRWCGKKTQLAMHYVDEDIMRKLWQDSCETYTVPC